MFGDSDFGVGVLISRLSGQPYFSVVTENSAGRQSCPASNLDKVIETDEPNQLQSLTGTRRSRLEVNGVYKSMLDFGRNKIPMLRSGLRQVLISNLTSDGTVASFLPKWMMWAYMLGVGFCTVAYRWLDRIKTQRLTREYILDQLPPTVWTDHSYNGMQKVMIEDLRASWVSPYWLLPTLSTVVPVILLKLFTATWRECVLHMRANFLSGSALAD